jgi:PAS domain S-box-containing protein
MNPRTRALITVGTIITLLTLFFLYIFIQHQKNDLSNQINMQTENHEQLVKLMLDQATKSYQSRIESLIKNRVNIIQSFAAKDRDKLLKQVLPVDNLLKKENSYFQSVFFINPDDTVFLRVNKPQLYGDNISSLSSIVKQCNRDKKKLAGFEIIKGGLFYRIVYPVFMDKKYVGVVGFNIDVYYFFEQLSRTSISRAGDTDISQNSQTKIQIALAFPKQELKKVIFLKKSHIILGEYALFADQKSLFAKFSKNIDIKQPVQKLKIENHHYVSLHSAEFRNFQGSIIARAISLIDIEPYVEETQNAIKKIVLLSFAMLLITFTILWLNFNVLFTKIARLTNSLEQTNIELEDRVKRRTAKIKKEIIAKKQIEQELKVIFSTIPDPIVVYNDKGYPLYLNHAFTKIFGWNLNDVQGGRIPFVPENQKQLTLDKIEEIYNSSEPVRFETKRLSIKGKLLDVVISAAVIKDIKGIKNGIVVIAKDITEQKTVEIQLRQAQKMEAIGTLAGGIAHDFNNILSGIFGYAQLAQMNIKNPEKALKKIDQVVKGAQRASDLVQQILTISRHTEQSKQPLALFLIVKEAVKFLRSSLPSTIKIETDIDSKAKILADPGQIHQVIMNLGANASQSMENSDGTLSVSLKDIIITEQDEMLAYTYMPGKFIKLEIKDTGCGMDNQTLDKIFNPYFTTKEIGKGTGLGLAVVDGIVKKHDGFIKLFSKINQGSKFEVFWPVIEEEISVDDEIFFDDISTVKGSEKIMVVGDEPDILETSKLILEKLGYKVSTFKDGFSAIEAFKENPDFFDLIITDMTMPQMTGDKLAVDILKRRSNMPIIICTGFSEALTEEKAASIGIKGYIMKPFLIKDLEKKIRELLKAKVH